MSYAFDYDETRNLVMVRFAGHISHEEEMAALQLLRDPRIKPDPMLFSDRRESRIGSTADEVRTMVHAVGETLAPLGQPRVAIVVGNDADYGVMRMFELMGDADLDHLFGVFRDFDAGCAWLGLDPDRVSLPPLPDAD